MINSPDTSEVVTSQEANIGFGVEAIHASIVYMQLDEKEYFVIGGANLVLQRIRERTPDLDLMVSQEVFNWMATLKGVAYEPPGLSSPDRGKDTVTLWLYNDFTPIPISATTSISNSDHPLSFESHKDKVEVITGVPCLLLEEVAATKEFLYRERDKRDLKLIMRRLSRGESLAYENMAMPLHEFGVSIRDRS